MSVAFFAFGQHVGRAFEWGLGSGLGHFLVRSSPVLGVILFGVLLVFGARRFKR